jgi:hypothetical protein
VPAGHGASRTSSAVVRYSPIQQGGLWQQPQRLYQPTQPAAGGGGSTPHRYWRVRSTATYLSSPNALAYAEVAFRATAGGSALSFSGRPLATTLDGSGDTYSREKAFDANNATFWSTLGASAPGGGHYIGIDLGSGVSSDVNEVVLRVRPDAFREDPQDIHVEWSDDGTNWTEKWAITGIGAWSAGEQRVYAFSSGYSLTADVGNYTLTGTATAPKVGRNLVASTGAYAITGQAVGVKRGFRLVGAVGSYALVGTATTLRIARRLAAAAGAYALTGTAALLKAGRSLVATPGSYTLTGQNVTLIKTGGYTLGAAPGAYVLTGTAANLLRGRRLIAAVGSYAIAGQAAGLRIARLLTAQSGAYAYTGNSANLIYTPLGAYLLTADAGTYVLNGTPASLRLARKLSLTPGAYILSGQPVTLTALVQSLFVRDTAPANVGLEGSPTPATLTLAAAATPEDAPLDVAAVSPLGAFVKDAAPGAVELTD